MKKIIAILSVVCIVAAVRMVIAAGEWDSSSSTSDTTTAPIDANTYPLINVKVVNRITPKQHGEKNSAFNIDFSENGLHFVTLTGTCTATIVNDDNATGGYVVVTQGDGDPKLPYGLIISIDDGGTFTATNSGIYTQSRNLGEVDIWSFIYDRTGDKYYVDVAQDMSAVDQGEDID